MPLNLKDLIRILFKNRIYSAIFVLLCISPTILLVVQYFHMHTTISRLLEYQEDYRSYAMTLKRIIRDKTKITSDENSSEVKKKIFVAINEDFLKLVGNQEVFSSDCDEPLFRLVNRNPKYLFTNARDFARKNKIEKDFLEIFKDLPQFYSNKKNKNKKNKRFKNKSLRTIQGLPLHLSTINFQEKASKEKHDFVCIWPLKKGTYRLSSGFGPRKIARYGWRLHAGLDLAASSGTPVYAVAGGTVVQAGWYKGYGNCVTISHGRKYKTRYGHMKKITVSLGEKLQQGHLVGHVGNTGNVVGRNGMHLHFEIHSFGKPINPLLCLVS